MVIQCVMHDEEDILGLKPDRTYRATGTVSKFVQGRPLVLKDCFLREDGSSAAAAPQGGVPARADAGPGVARAPAGLPKRLIGDSHVTRCYFRRDYYHTELLL